MPHARKTVPEVMPILVAIPRAAAMLDTTDRNIRTKLREGRLIAVKDGQRTLITVASIKAFAASLPAATFLPMPAQSKPHVWDALDELEREACAKDETTKG